jgi:hypothetical protein
MDDPAKIEAQEEQEDKRSTRSSIILAILAVLVAVYCVEFGLQTLTWIEAREWRSANPWLADAAQTLPAPAASSAKGAPEKFYEYEFTVPWSGKSKITQNLTSAEFRYDSGQVIVFFDPDSQVDTIHKLKASSPADYQKFMAVFGNKPIDTNYALYQSVYGAAPTQISPFMSASDALRINVLLLWKLSFGPDLTASGGPEFSSFDWGKLRGFQFGDPAKDHPVAVRVFDDKDQQFRFIFTVAGGSSGKITQDDVSSIVQSLQPVPLTER